jgi:hypothetical protein
MASPWPSHGLAIAGTSEAFADRAPDRDAPDKDLATRVAVRVDTKHPETSRSYEQYKPSVVQVRSASGLLHQRRWVKKQKNIFAGFNGVLGPATADDACCAR